MAGLTDEDVGITQFVSDLPGFQAIIKHRYADFQVTEVDPQGQLAELTSLESPAETVGESLPVSQLAEALPDAVAAFKEVAGDHCASLLQQLLQEIVVASKEAAIDAPAATEPLQAGQQAAGTVVHGKDGSLSITLPPIADKETRKAVHNFFKCNPKVPELTTVTLTGAAEASSTLQQASDGGSGQRGRGGRGRIWERMGGRFAAAARQASAEPPAAQQPQSSGKPTGPSAGSIQVVWHPQGQGGGRAAGQGAGRGGRGGGRGRGRGGGDARGQWGGSADEKYIKFVLYKENMDTQVALDALARALHLRSQQSSPWSFAGTKDKRAITMQWVTAFKLAPGKLASANKNYGLRGVRVGNFQYSKQQLGLGDLSGNRFRILMRNISPLPAAQNVDLSSLQQQVANSCASLAQHGFINYFGLQRFGTAGTPTHLVGLSLLQGSFSDAVDLIMGAAPQETAGTNGTDKPTQMPADEDAMQNNSPVVAQTGVASSGAQAQKPEVLAARQAWLKDRDAQAALKQLPHWMIAERATMGSLASATKPAAKAQAGSGPTHTVTAQLAAQPQPAPADAKVEGEAEPDAKRPRTDAKDTDVSESVATVVKTSLTPRVAADALSRIPRTLRMMYLHAWQSRVWNMAASHRIKTYGDRVVPGDLVLMPASGGNGSNGLQGIAGDVAGDDADLGVEVEGGREEGDQAANQDGAGKAAGTGATASRLANVRVVTEEDVACGRYSMKDVVLPLPGTRVQYPQHATNQVYVSACADIGQDVPQTLPGDLPGGSSSTADAQASIQQDASGTIVQASVDAMHVDSITQQAGEGEAKVGQKRVRGNTGTSQPTWAAAFSFSSLTGDYRRVLLRPRNFNYRLLTYSNPNDDALLPSPLGQLIKPKNTQQGTESSPGPAENAEAVPQQQPSASSGNVSSSTVQAAVAGPGGPLLALLLDFHLPSSTYATMLIREITRQATSRTSQAALSAAVTDKAITQ